LPVDHEDLGECERPHDGAQFVRHGRGRNEQHQQHERLDQCHAGYDGLDHGPARLEHERDQRRRQQHDGFDAIERDDGDALSLAASGMGVRVTFLPLCSANLTARPCISL
jgi:hypothetical protein